MTGTPGALPARRPRQADTVERAADAIRELAIRYRIRPGERVREGELARHLSISRTPLREALNRLVSEGFITFVPNRGFFCRGLDAKEVVDLYETRAALEAAAFRLACERATEAGIEEAVALWQAVEPRPDGTPIRDLARADESFHLAIAGLSGNDEMLRLLEGISARIRFFREIDLENRERSGVTSAEHRTIIDALRARDAEAGAAAIAAHVGMSAEHAVEVAREGLARISLGAA